MSLYGQFWTNLGWRRARCKPAAHQVSLLLPFSARTGSGEEIIIYNGSSACSSRPLLFARAAYFVCGVMNKGHLIKIMALLNVIQISRQRQIAPHFAAPHCVKGKNDRTLFGRCDSINKFHLGARALAHCFAARQKLISRMTRRVLFFICVSSAATFCSLRAGSVSG